MMPAMQQFPCQTGHTNTAITLILLRHALQSCGFAAAFHARRSNSLPGRLRQSSALQATTTRRVIVQQPATTRLVQPQYRADDWFFTEKGQLSWVEAMELDTLTPDLPELLAEMGINYNPDRLAAQLSSKWPQVGSESFKTGSQ
jgi:hypothetical protein